MDVVRPLDWAVITDYLARGRCVPILGAAANVTSAARGYEGLPLAADVARALNERMGFGPEDTADLDLDLDLAKVALEFQFKAGRPHLIRTLGELIPDEAREPSPLLKTLARLPLRLIITTNYDRLMERALEEAGKSYVVVSQPLRRGPRAQRSLLDKLAGSTDLILYKIHGTFGGDELTPESIVITEDDYIDLLSVINTGGIPPLILSKLVDGIGLILGYSVKDWDFRMIYRSLPRNQMRQAFAVLKGDPSRFWIEYLRQMNFHVFTMDVYEFADELGRRWEPVGRSS